MSKGRLSPEPLSGAVAVTAAVMQGDRERVPGAAGINSGSIRRSGPRGQAMQPAASLPVQREEGTGRAAAELGLGRRIAWLISTPGSVTAVSEGPGLWDPMERTPEDSELP